MIFSPILRSFLARWLRGDGGRAINLVSFVVGFLGVVTLALWHRQWLLAWAAVGWALIGVAALSSPRRP